MLRLEKLALWLCFGLMLTLSCVAGAEENETQELTPESRALLEQLEAQIKGTVLAVSEYEQSAGRNMENFYFTANIPAQNSINLGMVLNTEKAAGGFEVLSVTPGGMAEKLAIVSGDRLLAINDIQVDKNTKDDALLQLQTLSPGESLKLALVSDGEVKNIDTIVEGQFVPGIKLELGTQSFATTTDENRLGDAGGECGELSVFYSPPETRDIFPAFVSRINNESVMRNRHSFRLPPGKYIVSLHELIDDPFFKPRGNWRKKAKEIEIDVQANKSYHLGAVFHRDKKYQLAKSEYWEPVIWRVKERECQL